jgi:hypothetical protein
MGDFSTSHLYGQFDAGEDSQVVDGSSQLLQGFSDELGPSIPLTVERCFQVVVNAAILKHLSNLFVRGSGRDTTYNVGSRLIEGGDEACDFLPGVQKLCSVMVSNCRRNMARDVDLSNLAPPRLHRLLFFRKIHVQHGFNFC